jgi:hypothetical protein
MKARSSLRNIDLRLDSLSYKLLKTIRNGREVLLQPQSAIPIIPDVAYVADNMPNNEGKLLEGGLERCSLYVAITSPQTYSPIFELNTEYITLSIMTYSLYRS